jgi:hypothetical protein
MAQVISYAANRKLTHVRSWSVADIRRGSEVGLLNAISGKRLLSAHILPPSLLLPGEAIFQLLVGDVLVLPHHHHRFTLPSRVDHEVVRGLLRTVVQHLHRFLAELPPIGLLSVAQGLKGR